MIKNCDNCSNRVSFKTFYKEMLKDRYAYTCTECGTVHKATIFSIIINSIIFLSPIIALIGKWKFFLLTIPWTLFANLVIQPFILQYRIQKN